MKKRAPFHAFENPKIERNYGKYCIASDVKKTKRHRFTVNVTASSKSYRSLSESRNQRAIQHQ